MLPVVLDPVGTPAVLSKGVDAAPCGNGNAIVELLRATISANPKLTNDQNNREKDSVCDECTPHNEMGCALAGMVSLTKAKSSDAAKDHLRPCHHRHQLTKE